MLKLSIHTPGEPTKTITTSAVARDIAKVAGAIMRLPVAPKLYFSRDDSANNDIHAQGIVRGAKIIHRDPRVPFTDEYLMVTHVHRYTNDSGMHVTIAARPYHDAKATPFVFTVRASQTVELFTIEQLA